MSDQPTPRPDLPSPLSPPLIDRRPTPLGVMPRQLPRWLLLGVTVVMMGIMALSGAPTRSRSTSTGPAATATAVDPNQQRIEEYQRRIQEQTQRLAAEQAALQAVKDAAETRPDSPGTPARALTPPLSVAERQPRSDRVSGEPRAARGDRSLFADSVAFTREPHATAASASGSLETPMPAPLVSPSRTTVSPAESVAPPVAAPAGAATIDVAPGDSRAMPSEHAPAAPRVTPRGPTEPRRYEIPEGTIIETVLTNRLDGTYAGPVNCLVTTAVYAPDHEHVLIPAGARVLGDARAVTTFGQSRLAVVFHRVLLPNGARIDLQAFHGLNQIGETGLRDQVDRHYAQIFGASLAVGAIAGLAQAQTSVGLDATALDAYRQGAAANLAQSSARILDRFLNLLPTVTIREGHRIKVYLSNDLEVPAYRDDQPTPRPRTTGGRS